MKERAGSTDLLAVEQLLTFERGKRAWAPLKKCAPPVLAAPASVLEDASFVGDLISATTTKAVTRAIVDAFDRSAATLEYALFLVDGGELMAVDCSAEQTSALDALAEEAFLTGAATWSGRAAALPLVGERKLLGVLALAAKRGSTFVALERARLVAAVQNVARALERAEHVEGLERQLTSAIDESKRKDMILGTVAHEMRGPITSVMLWLGLLGTEAVDPRIERGLGAIERSTRLSSRLVNDIAEFARSRPAEVTLCEANVREMIAHAIEMVQPFAAQRSVRLHCEIDEATCETIQADPERIVQVVTNVVTNAVKFSEQGGEVRVHLEQVDDALKLSVRDDGVGLDEETSRHMFEPFWQAGDAKRGGLGLGLTIVKRLVEAHGGTVTAASDGPRRGTRIDISLPTSGAT